MAVVVVGGSRRKVGKTSAVCALLRATPELRWVAIKMTTHGHGADVSASASVELREETQAGEENDSSRYLAAGALRSFYVSVPESGMAEAMPVLKGIIAEAENTVVESTSVVEFLDPDVAVLIVGEDVADMKNSARRLAGRFDARVATVKDAVSFVLSRM